MQLWRKRILDILFVVVLFYISGLLAFYFIQRNFVYFPNPQRQDMAAYNATDMQVVKTRTEDGLELEGWYKPAKGDKPVIVLFHGNASHPGMSAWKVRPFVEEGYGALLPAYRGYAGNPGKPTEQGLYKDAKAFLSWLSDSQKVPQDKIILYGESLGTGVAVEMAASEFSGVKGVVLESPYTSFVDLAKKHYPLIPLHRLLVKDKYKSIEKIGRVKAPLYIISGRMDFVVPVTQGERLFAAAAEPKKMDVLPMAGHNDLYNYGAGQRVLHFLSGL